MNACWRKPVLMCWCDDGVSIIVENSGQPGACRYYCVVVWFAATFPVVPTYKFGDSVESLQVWAEEKLRLPPLAKAP